MCFFNNSTKEREEGKKKRINQVVRMTTKLFKEIESYKSDNLFDRLKKNIATNKSLEHWWTHEPIHIDFSGKLMKTYKHEVKLIILKC